MTNRETLRNLAERAIDCPRCHQTCGWCGDYRHMHGQIKLPGSRKYCTLTEVMPEGDNCPLCHGTKRVVATTTYAPAASLRAIGEGL